MGIVTEYLRELIARQVPHGPVVWFDPERHYADVAANLELPETVVASYTEERGFPASGTTSRSTCRATPGPSF